MVEASIFSWDTIYSFFVDQLMTNEFFATAGVFGVLRVIWEYTKHLPKKLWERIERRLTFTAHVYQTDEFFRYLEQWLRDNHETSYRNVEIDLEEIDDDHNNMPDEYLMRNKQGKYSDVPPNEEIKFKQFKDIFFLRRGLIFIRVFKGREKMENVTDLRMAYLNRFELSGIFAKRAIKKLLKEVLDYNLALKEANKSEKISIYTSTSDYWTQNTEVYPKPIESVILDKKQALLDDVDNFIKSKSWYKDRQIPYKRGYMFYGKPGNGKTTLAMSLAQHLRRDLYMLTMGKAIEDRDLQRLFRNLPMKSVLILEDVDALFGTDRENEEAKFSFSTLLNCLDGVLSKEDIITIFTTNHPERLDEALIREGRIDYKLEVSNPTKGSIEDYLTLFYQQEGIEVTEFGGSGIPMVEIQNICLRNKTDKDSALEQINIKLSA